MFFIIIIFLLAFKNYWQTSPVCNADFYYPPFLEQIQNRPEALYAWDTQKNFGIGGASFNTLWIDAYSQVFNNFLIIHGFSVVIVQKLLFFIPLTVFLIFSPYLLFRKIFPDKKKYACLAVLVYSLNTYILMIAGGGQIGIALSYAVSPLVVWSFIKMFEKDWRLRPVLFTGLLLSLNLFYDLRIALLSAIIAFSYAVLSRKIEIKHLISRISILAVITFGIHAFWLLPIIIMKNASAPAGLLKTGWIDFLSFPDFSNSFSLLQPNWPENIFGKIYFMRPEFLLLPVLAFSSLFFAKNNKKIVFFAFLGLLGAFLSKGVKPPLPDFYRFLYDTVPGFSIFRDPTKFYLLTSLSYSMLIPITLSNITKTFSLSNKSVLKKNLGIFSIFLVILYLLFLVRPVFTTQLSGTFKKCTVPKEYFWLKDKIYSQNHFFRNLWIPIEQRFGFFSDINPRIDAHYFFDTTNNKKIVNKIADFGIENLRMLGVKYVIIPFDSENEIFLTDRIYDSNKKIQIEKDLAKIKWLKKIASPQKLAIFEIKNPHDRIYLKEGSGNITYKMINPTKYLVKININNPDTVIFSENYDPFWQFISLDKKVINSQKYNRLINSFRIEKKGTVAGIIEYKGQYYVYLGSIISISTFLGAVVLLIFKK